MRPGSYQGKTYFRNHVQGLYSSRFKEEPQYLIKSDKTDHLAMHKGSALQLIAKRKTYGPKIKN